MMPRPMTPTWSGMAICLPLRVSTAERSHRHKQRLDRFTRNIAHDEDDARARIGVLSMLERDRRMKHMLRALQHHGATLARQLEDTFHAQEIRAAQRSQRLEGRVQFFPGERLVEPKTE